MKKILITIGIIVVLLLVGVTFKGGKTGAPINVLTSATNTSVSVSAATSTTVLTGDSGRTYAVFSNDSANVIYLFLGPTATANKGVRIAVNGQYELANNNQYTGIVTAIASSSTSTLTVSYK